MSDTTHTDSADAGARVSSNEVDRHSARAALYGALGAAFCYPTAERLADLRDDTVQERLLDAGERLGLTAETATFLDALAGTDCDDARAAYDALFGLPGEEGSYPVVPYEGQYTTDGDVGTEQRRIATVVGLMEAFGVTPAEEFDERQDHVAAELELAAVVAAQRALAADDPDRDRQLGAAEATLLEEHLVGFVPAFGERLQAATDTDLYAAAGALAAALVRQDAASSAEVTGDA